MTILALSSGVSFPFNHLQLLFGNGRNMYGKFLNYPSHQKPVLSHIILLDLYKWGTCKDFGGEQLIGHCSFPENPHSLSPFPPSSHSHAWINPPLTDPLSSAYFLPSPRLSAGLAYIPPLIHGPSSCFPAHGVELQAALMGFNENLSRFLCTAKFLFPWIQENSQSLIHYFISEIHQHLYK